MRTAAFCRASIAALVAAAALGWALLGDGAGLERPTPAAGAGTHKAFVPQLVADSAAAAGASPAANPFGVRYCGWLPGTSKPAQMPPEVLNPSPPDPKPAPTPPPQTSVPVAATQQQLDAFNALWVAVALNYVDPGFNGRDWDAMYEKYLGYIEAGLATPVFHETMRAMLGELGDDHSNYQTPEEVAQEDARLAEGASYVGIGVFAQPIDDSGASVIIAVFPGSPAEKAGLRSHDLIIEVDGKPPIDPETGAVNVRGPLDSTASLLVQHPGGAPFTLSIQRQQVTGGVPVDYCIVKGTSIGYLMVPTLLDSTIADQVHDALQELSKGGPLSGLILDNRMNGGGLSSQAEGLLGFFLGGVQGYAISRESTEPFEIESEDISGSQSAPLVVLVGEETASFGEITSGVLRHSGRATTVGRTTGGNVELLSAFELPNGGRAWIATYTFQPIGLATGVWEDTGVIADISAPTRWDLFTEANDPAMGKALEVLGVD